jgi:hypothetical protein
VAEILLENGIFTEELKPVLGRDLLILIPAYGRASDEFPWVHVFIGIGAGSCGSKIRG